MHSSLISKIPIKPIHSPSVLSQRRTLVLVGSDVLWCPQHQGPRPPLVSSAPGTQTSSGVLRDQGPRRPLVSSGTRDPLEEMPSEMASDSF
ncbi:hypothetical protein NHX12_000140 [Muraenolepis orangiensis]|uniref:Uncharacterized protein n=1 Tax=Muraenolepis orangiensis TaxID=630683 RepID=A0A9Q0D9H6_9TELE|nr:hypothetical protein NHX12_000140 [Muraenolepis orangiensis]